MGISKFNGSKNVEWGVDTKSLPFKKTSQVELDEIYELKGFFITPDTNGYGEGAVLISDGFLLNAPQRYVDIIKQMLADDEVIRAVKNGDCSFRVYTFKSKNYNRTGYGVEFIDN